MTDNDSSTCQFFEGNSYIVNDGYYEYHYADSNFTHGISVPIKKIPIPLGKLFNDDSAGTSASCTVGDVPTRENGRVEASLSADVVGLDEAIEKFDGCEECDFENARDTFLLLKAAKLYRAQQAITPKRFTQNIISGNPNPIIDARSVIKDPYILLQLERLIKMGYVVSVHNLEAQQSITDEMVEGAARVWSGAPFPSKKSLDKSRAALEAAWGLK